MSYSHNHNSRFEARTDCPGCLAWHADILESLADVAAGRVSTFVSWNEFEAAQGITTEDDDGD